MLESIQLPNILFLDIETVPVAPSFSHLSELEQKLWTRKAAFIKSENESPADVYPRAGIYAEFGKIICISVGFFTEIPHRKFRLTSFAGENEIEILENFSSLVNRHFNKPENLLCAHNGKEFDFPFISRRMLIHGLPLPVTLNSIGKKPWEVNHLDTLDLWKFGDYKNYTSLELLASVFNIPTPKDDISGSDIWWVYWKEKNFQRIVTYCRKDVLTIARILLRFKGEPVIDDKDVIII